jgi:hypothetical protein
MGLAILAGSVATGAFAGLRSLGDARASLRARLCSLPPEAILTLVGAFAAGAIGYAYGFAAATTLIAATWWGFFLAAVRRREADDARDAGHRSGGSPPGPSGPVGSAAWFPPEPPLPQPISGSAL